MTKKALLKVNFMKLAVSFFAVLLIISFCFPFPWIEWGTAHADDDNKKITKINGKLCAADEIIIKFKDNPASEKNSNTLNAIDSAYKSLPVRNTVKIKIPEGKTLEEYLDELRQNPDIAYAQPNFLYKLDASVNDPFASPSADDDYQWFHDKINTFEAWDYTMGAGATVAILDTGAFISHPDLGANITLIPDIASNDNDGLPYDYSSVPQDDDIGHGTHVAGIIAATDNTVGGLGIAPNCNVIVYDVFEHFEVEEYDEEIEEWVRTGVWKTRAFTDDVIVGIEAAVTYGARVINMSFGSFQDPESEEYWDLAFEAAVDAAVANGVVVVCSAGNDNLSDVDYDTEDDVFTFHRPSDYGSAISVINTDINDNKAASSNYGPLKDISAPGENIVSTMNNGSYVSLGGTSMSSPVIVGVCALILSANPSLSVEQVKNILYSTADDLGAEGRDDFYGWGRVNAQAAVLMALDMVYKVELDEETMDVELGHTGTLTATIFPASATDENISWSSDDEDIATVSSDGTVTGVSTGTVTITVTNTGDSFVFTDTCEVTVVPVSVTGVSLDKETTEIVIGGSDTLTATVAPADAANQNITWSSDNEAVATVADGVVTSVSVGSAVITVTTEDGGNTDTCDVDVIPIPVSGVTLYKESTSLYVGASEIIKYTISPDSAANKNVTWDSNNESVATVDSSGMVTAVSAGSATITITTESGSHTDTCTVSVGTLTPVTVDETIKVKLSIGSSTSVSFYVDGNFSVLGGSGDALERQQYNIGIDGSNLVLKLGTSEIDSSPTITLTQHEGTTGNNFIWIDNYEHGPVGYWGDIVFSISGGVIQAINHVYLEDYLYGVVPHEMSDSWPAEALKAQAIAARTYAASSIGGGAYDVADTSSDQVYEGYDDGNTNAIAAVDGTQKKVLQQGDTLTQTYYAASNGGYTDIPYHVWGSEQNLPFTINEDTYDVANTSSLYEKIFFPVVIDGPHPITVSDNVDGTPNITNAVDYIKKQIYESGQLSGYGVATVNDFDLTGALDLVPHTHDSDGSEDLGCLQSESTIVWTLLWRQDALPYLWAHKATRFQTSSLICGI